MILSRFEDRLGFDHDPEVDDLEVVAFEDQGDDVLADVMHIALDGGHDGDALLLMARSCFVLLQICTDTGLKGIDGDFHHPSALHHLR